jgi:acetyltransferase-like isoleucine patch superfamily enzyme
MSKERFDNWVKPDMTHGVLTKWNWMAQHPENIVIGYKSDIGAFTYMNGKHGIELGNNVQLGSHCSIYSESTIDNKSGKVIIGDNTCVGSHSTIMPGVKIGKNCLIGAHSFVNKSIPDNTVAFGVPVKIRVKNEV